MPAKIWLERHAHSAPQRGLGDRNPRLVKRFQKGKRYIMLRTLAWLAHLTRQISNLLLLNPLQMQVLYLSDLAQKLGSNPV
jgi:hypothetical protein